MDETYEIMDGVAEIERQVKADYGEDARLRSVKFEADVREIGADGAVFEAGVFINGTIEQLAYFVGISNGRIYAEKTDTINSEN